MTDHPESVLSKHSKKLAHDIYFSMDIGRSSPFDPFAGRDITKLFSTKKERSYALSYMPEVQSRHTPAVASFRGTGREASFLSPQTVHLADVFYEPSMLDTGKHVSFTKAPRAVLSGIPDAAAAKRQRRKESVVSAAALATTDLEGNASSNAAASGKKLSKKERELLKAQAEHIDLMTARERTKHKQLLEELRAEVELEQRKAMLLAPTPTSAVGGMRPGPSFGRGSGRDGHSPQNARSASTPAAASRTALDQGANSTTSTRRQPLQRNTVVFPWDKPKQKAVNPLVAAMKAKAGTEGGGDAKDATSPSGANSPTAQTAQQPRLIDQVEEEEQWLDKRKQFIQRFGLLGGTSRYKGRSSGPSGPDLAGMPSRNAPVHFQSRVKETHDLSYRPRFEATTKVRSVAHVELGRQASRFPQTSTYQSQIRDLLSYDHLSKLHQQSRSTDHRSLDELDLHVNPPGKSAETTFGGSVGSPMDAARRRRKPDEGSKVFEKPLSSADEVAFNWSSLRAPSRAITPSAALKRSRPASVG